MPLNPAIKSTFVSVDNLKLHYLSAGSGETVLLLHGWPTSSYLWRNMIVPMSKNKQVIALDLPGFGQSDKPIDASFSFNYFERTISGFLKELDINKVHLVVHDLGGPVGAYWAIRNPEKVNSLAFLNTLIYPNLSWAVKLFILGTKLPVVQQMLSSSQGLKRAMLFGVFNKQNLTKENFQNYQAPFKTKQDRQVLIKAAQRLHIKGLHEIALKLPKFKVPVRLIYGDSDKILPNVADTMAHLKQDLPQAQLSILPNCGHFLQEDEPGKLSQMLNSFYSSLSIK